MLRVVLVVAALLGPLAFSGAAAGPSLAQGGAAEAGWARGSFVAEGASGIWLTLSFAAPSPEAVALMSLEFPTGSSSTMTFLWDDEELVVHSDVAGLDMRADASTTDDAGTVTLGFECNACHTGSFAFVAMTAGGVGAWSWSVRSDRATFGPAESGVGNTFVHDVTDLEGPANVALAAYTGASAAVSTRVSAENGIWARFFPETTVSGSAVSPQGVERACPCLIGKALAPAAAGTWEFRASGVSSAAGSGSWIYGIVFPSS